MSGGYGQISLGRQQTPLFDPLTVDNYDTNSWMLAGAAYYDKSKNVSVVGQGTLGNGKRYTLAGVAKYALSKRTQVYTTVDYNKAKDAAQVELAGKNIM